jgi:dienelactone hydrolase
MGGALAFASLASIKGFKGGAPFYGTPDINNFKV